MYSKWYLDIGKLCFIFTRILCILAKQQAIDIDSYFVEGIRNKEFWYLRRASHNTVDALEMERHLVIILLMKSDRDLRHTISIEKHSRKGRLRLRVETGESVCALRHGLFKRISVIASINQCFPPVVKNCTSIPRMISPAVNSSE